MMLLFLLLSPPKVDSVLTAFRSLSLLDPFPLNFSPRTVFCAAIRRLAFFSALGGPMDNMAFFRDGGERREIGAEQADFLDEKRSFQSLLHRNVQY